MIVCHRCDNRKCINPDHLFVGTDQDNRDDCVRKDRHNAVHGERVNTNKIPESEITGIREYYANEISLGRRRGTVRYLAKKHGVIRANIYFILRGATWKHLLPSAVTQPPQS